MGPLLDDLLAFETVDAGAGDVDLAVGGVHSEEVALVGSTGAPVDDDLVAFGDGVVDGEVEIGEGPAAVWMPVLGRLENPTRLNLRYWCLPSM